MRCHKTLTLPAATGTVVFLGRSWPGTDTNKNRFSNQQSLTTNQFTRGLAGAGSNGGEDAEFRPRAPFLVSAV